MEDAANARQCKSVTINFVFKKRKTKVNLKDK